MATQSQLARRFRRRLPHQAEQPTAPPFFHALAATIGFKGRYAASQQHNAAVLLYQALTAVYHDSSQAPDGWYVPDRDVHIMNRHTLAHHQLIEQREELARGRYVTYARITPAGCTALDLPDLSVSERTLMSDQLAPELPATSADPAPLPMLWVGAGGGDADESAPQIAGDTARIYIHCANCACIFADPWPAWFLDLYGPQRLYKQALTMPAARLCVVCRPEAHTPSRASTDPVAIPLFLDGDDPAEIADLLADPAPESAAPTEGVILSGENVDFFAALEKQIGLSLAHLESDQHVLLRGHRPNLDAIRRYAVCRSEQVSILEYRIQQQTAIIERQKEIIEWWQREAENYHDLATRHAVPERFGGSGTIDPRLSRADQELLNDLCHKHLDLTLSGALDVLHLGELADFAAEFTTLTEAISIIGKRIVDHGLAVLACAARSKGKRGGGHYLALHYGFGEVNLFDKEIRVMAMRYPRDIDYDKDDFDIDLDPPVQIILQRDSRGYPRVDTLTIAD